MIRRPCIHHRCTRYAVQGGSRCAVHELERERKRWDEGSTGSRGSRPGWRRLRVKVWREQGRRCGVCRDDVREFFLHHRDGDATNNDRANLIALCRPCHKMADAALRAARRTR